MDLLERNERFWQRLFDNFFRGGTAPLQPVEIARRVAKKMAAERTISINNVYVPNVYHVYLSPVDFERLSAFEKSLAEELADYLAERAEDQDLTMVGEVRVELEVDDALSSGEMKIHARMEEEGTFKKPVTYNTANTAEDKTLVFKSPVEVKDIPAATTLKLVVKSGPDTGRSFITGFGRQVIGRQPTCDFVLTDEQVSRRHCRLEENHERFLLTDLGSRNGTFVNDKKIDRILLKPGDKIRLGRTVLEVLENRQ